MKHPHEGRMAEVYRGNPDWPTPGAGPAFLWLGYTAGLTMPTTRPVRSGANSCKRGPWATITKAPRGGTKGT